MRVVESYQHQTGEHCASTALRNILRHQGVEMSEGMIFGLASGLGFFYLQSDALSPTRMFHGRTATLESDFGVNTGVPLVDRMEPDDERAFAALRASIDADEPVMVSTDTFYLGYHNTTSHFPGHRAVVVGYDDDAEEVLIADRKFAAYQRCSYEELRRSRNAQDYPQRCGNQYGERRGELKLGRPLEEAVRIAIARNCETLLAPASETPGLNATQGIAGMRAAAADLPDWRQLADWSWAARFGYQIVVKRGAGGSFFRSLYAEFLEEASAAVPALAEGGFGARMSDIAAGWRDLAAGLKDQSERERCAPELFSLAGEQMTQLANAEEGFFRDLRRLADEERAPAL